MMLVISVIVALAILGVLINVIYSVVVTPGGSLDKLMQDQLKTQVSNTYGCSAPSKGTIKRGTTIFAKGVTGTILELKDGDKFTFDVDSSATTGVAGVTTSGSTVALTKLTTTGMTSGEAQVVFVVCANTQPAIKIVKICVAGRETAAKISGCTPT